MVYVHRVDIEIVICPIRIYVLAQRGLTTRRTTIHINLEVGRTAIRRRIAVARLTVNDLFICVTTATDTIAPCFQCVTRLVYVYVKTEFISIGCRYPKESYLFACILSLDGEGIKITKS